MLKKILFVSLVVLFSTALISKEKVFLDYGFLKDISERLDKACELDKKGKTVKAEKALKEINKEITDYLSKLGSFSLSKECSLVWTNGNVSGQLECLPHIDIFWGAEISKRVKEQIEDFTDNKDEYVFIGGDFKIYSIIKGMGIYARDISRQSCDSFEKKQKLQIYASLLSVTKKQDKKWSKFQGNMTWSEAKTKCESIGMRLPTIEELKFAPRNIWDKEISEAAEANVNKESGVLDVNAENEPYWSLNKLRGFAPNMTIDENDDTVYSEEDFRTWKYSVRCIGEKEFQFKK